MRPKYIVPAATILSCIIAAAVMQGCNTQTEQQSSTVSPQSSVTSANSTESTNEESNNTEYTEYLKDHGIDLSGIVVSEEGKIKRSDTEQDFASLRFEIKKDQEETARNRIKERCGDEFDEEDIIYPGLTQDEYLKKANSENIIASWYGFENGTHGAKTRSFQIFLTEKDGTYFVYFEG